MAQRDPLSVTYDPVVNDLLRLAIRNHVNHRRGPIAWVASPRREFRQLDRGGLTAHERAFTRAAYYEIFRKPRNEQRTPDWSLVLEWDKTRRLPAPGNRSARAVRVQIYRYGRAPKTDGYTFRSQAGARIDT